MPVIELSSVVKSFAGQPVLCGLDWQIGAGQVIGLLGRNGAGKSTLLECLLGLHDVDGGSALVYGESADNLSDIVRARIGYVPQQPALFEWLTPLQMLAYFEAMYPRWNAAKVAGLLGRWGFEGAMLKKPISTLSGGQKQRLSIIRALAHDPTLLVLDEPVASLDPAARRGFLQELINDVIERDTTVVFSTHILSDLERVALDVAFLKDGVIAVQGGLDDLLESAHRVSGPAQLFPAGQFDGEMQRGAGARPGDAVALVRMAPQQAAALRGARPGLYVETLALEELFIEVTQ